MGALTGRARRQAIPLVLIVILIGAGLPPLLSWQRAGAQRARSLSNLRRLANSLLLYAQDYDGRAMPPAAPLAGGAWRLWPEALQGYLTTPESLNNPANPVPEDGPPLRDPLHRYAVRTSYALNRRIWGVFSTGPFPLDNLELPSQTALFVEAGPMGRDPRRPGERSAQAVLVYGDTTDRFSSFYAYPSLHDGRIALVAVDGHAITVTVAHYGPADGPHDPLYGRIGGTIYDWNGGHPNGETD
ncbi:MAG TPA: hypothetical protein VKT32_07010, partial [Chthonomonadaceae bacterium]|nr:hypothetical protein [Chthonomonadaceae bacterium]